MIPGSSISISNKSVAKWVNKSDNKSCGIETYVKEAPGAIGHWVTLGTPSIQGVSRCNKPCQCIERPSSGSVISLRTVTKGPDEPKLINKCTLKKNHLESRLPSLLQLQVQETRR